MTGQAPFAPVVHTRCDNARTWRWSIVSNRRACPYGTRQETTADLRVPRGALAPCGLNAARGQEGFQVFPGCVGRIWLPAARLMTIMLVMSEILPLAEVKARFSEVVDRVATTHDRVVVTRNGRPAAVVVSPDELDALEETLAILSDPDARARVEEARHAVAEGDVVDENHLRRLLDELRQPRP